MKIIMINVQQFVQESAIDILRKKVERTKPLKERYMMGGYSGYYADELSRQISREQPTMDDIVAAILELADKGAAK